MMDAPVMADKTKFQRKEDVFWSKIGMESSEDDAYVPGLSAPGNKRPGRLRARKTKEVRASVPEKQPIVESKKTDFPPRERTLKGKPTKPILNNRQSSYSAPDTKRNHSTILEDSGMSTTFESFAERSIRRLQKASLKDLRPEDKQRVANLIKELARVGEEKEKVVQELHGEREQYEKQLIVMVEQQEKILQEREDIQEKLFQCQKLLTEYQAQLLNREEKLNSSIHEAQEAVGKVNHDRYPAETLVPPQPITSQSVKTKQRNPVQQDKQSRAVTHEKAARENPAGVVEICPPVYDLSEMDERSLTPVLMNRLPSPIQKQDPPRTGRQSRSHNQRQSANQSPLDNYLTNENVENESVTDLLLNPTETVKRPYTSMIDKEIARERSLSRGSRTSEYSRSRSASPSEGRPKFAYPQKLSSLGPLNEPLASSTQKSMEIRALNFENDSLRSRSLVNGHEVKSKGHSSKKSSFARDRSPADSDSAKNRVAFNEEDEFDDEAEKHSPNMKSPAQMFNDPKYAQFYKKLSPGGRKRELLKQRQALLDEQERLRLVLEKQERQLQARKYEHDKRKELQEQRMEFYKEGGKFPALKLDFDNGSEKGSSVKDDASDRGSTKGSAGRGRTSDVDSPRNNIEIDVDDVQVRSRVSMGTSPIATQSPSNQITIATTPVHSAEVPASETPRFIDVATSVSYRTPLKDTSNRVQGNLPLASNRQMTSPYRKTSQRDDGQEVIRTPGEKTLNVLELVNSMEEEQPVSSHLYRNLDDLENRPERHITPHKYLSHAKGSQSSPYRQYTSPGQQRTSQNNQLRTSQGKLLNDEEESLEENKILEDIFFL